jgi:hypothetical protein
VPWTTRHSKWQTWTIHGVYLECLVVTWILPGLHQDRWGSVKYCIEGGSPALYGVLDESNILDQFKKMTHLLRAWNPAHTWLSEKDARKQHKAEHLRALHRRRNHSSPPRTSPASTTNPATPRQRRTAMTHPPHTRTPPPPSTYFPGTGNP